MLLLLLPGTCMWHGVCWFEEHTCCIFGNMHATYMFPGQYWHATCTLCATCVLYAMCMWHAHTIWVAHSYTTIVTPMLQNKLASSGHDESAHVIKWPVHGMVCASVCRYTQFWMATGGVACSAATRKEAKLVTSELHSGKYRNLYQGKRSNCSATSDMVALRRWV